MSNTKKLWGGRFMGQTDPGFARFNRSFGFDRRLFEVARDTRLRGDEAGALQHRRKLLLRADAPRPDEAQDFLLPLRLVHRRPSRYATCLHNG